MAELTGKSGEVHALDIQREMLAGVKRRATRHNIEQCIRLHLVQPDNAQINIEGSFALAFWMFHEVPDPCRTIAQIKAMLYPGGLLLLAEPLFHVSKKHYMAAKEIICQNGFSIQDHPKIALSRATLFKKDDLFTGVARAIKRLCVNVLD